MLEDDGLNIATEYSLKIENYLYIILSCNNSTFSSYQYLDNTFILSSSWSKAMKQSYEVNIKNN